MFNPIFMSCLIAILAQLCVACICYLIGALKFDSGLRFGIYGWLACLAMQGIYFFYVFWAASIRTLQASGESRRILNFFRYYKQTLSELSDSMKSTDVDHYLERLLAADQLELAAQHANEQLVNAHEQGDQKKEKTYRQALEEINHRRGVNSD